MKFGSGGNLPPGVHVLSWKEFRVDFGATSHRRLLLSGLEKALTNLKSAGCRRVYLNGSFVTDKERVWGLPPNGYDGCWDISTVDPAKIDPVLLNCSDGRAAQKAKYLGELFPAEVSEGTSGRTFLQFFQIDKQTGRPKGIVMIELKDFP